MTFALFQTVRNTARMLSSVLALTTALVAGVGLSDAASAQVAKDDATYTIKRAYKTGDADRYRVALKMNMDVAGMPVDMAQTILMKETTKEAKADGSRSVTFDFESMIMTVNGMENDMTSMLPKITTTMDKDGKSDVKVEGGSQELTAQMGDQIKRFTDAASAFTPKKPVKIGDSWDLNASDFGAPGQTVKGKSTFVSVERIKGMQVGKIKSVIEITADMGVMMHSETTSLIDIATGKALSVTSKTDGEAAGSKMNMEMTMKLLSPDDKGDVKAAVKADSAPKKP